MPSNTEAGCRTIGAAASLNLLISIMKKGRYAMRKKFTACFIVFCLFLLLLGSCGGENKNENDSTQSVSGSTAGKEDNTGTADTVQTAEAERTTETLPQITTEQEKESPDYLLLYVDEKAKLIDDPSTNDLGGGGNPIQFVDDNGIGYSSLNDIVYFENVDFGEKGAKEMTIFFSNGNRDGNHSTLSVYIDDYENNEPIALFDIKYTGGWDSSYAKEFSVECPVPAGKHTVYIQFTNENSGSFTWISFAEAD